MTRFFPVLVLSMAISAFAAEAPKVVAAVTLAPYAKILAEVGGDRVEVIGLVPANANPHTFEPKPETLKAFARASLYFSDSSGMDRAWMPRFLGVNKNVRVEKISSGVAWLKEDHHDGDGKELDPHLWTSPKQALRLGRNMEDALVRADPKGKPYYEGRLAAFTQKMNDLDKVMLAAVSKMPKDSKVFLVFHPSFGYLARDYGLTQMAVEAEGKEPKPRDLAKIVSTARAHKVRIIFVQPQFSKRAAQTLASEIPAKVVTTDPLAYDFESNLRAFAKSLESAVAPQGK